MTGRCSHLNIEIDDQPGENEGLKGLAKEFDRLQSLDRELSLAQRWVDGRLNEVLDRLNGHIGAEADSRFYAAVLSAVVTTDGTLKEIADGVDADPEAVEEILGQLAEGGLVQQVDSDEWELA